MAIIMALALCMSGGIATQGIENECINVLSAEAEETSEWKTVYAEYLNGLDKSEEIKFKLIYIDDNDIPELLVWRNYFIGVFTCVNNNITNIGSISAMGLMGYSEKNNIMEISTYKQGKVISTYYEFKEGVVTCLCYKSYYDEATYLGDDEYSIDGNAVTKEEYEDYISKFDSYEFITIDANDTTTFFINNEENINAYFGVANDVTEIETSVTESPATESEPPATETEPPVTETEPPVTEILTEWKNAYADFLSSSAIKNEGSFYLAYIDEDDVPELLCSGLVDGSNSILVYKYSNEVTGNVKSLDTMDNYEFSSISADKSVSYLEKSNLLCVTDAKSSGSTHYIFSIENDEIVEKITIGFNGFNDWYHINDVEVTKEEYNKKCEEYGISSMVDIRSGMLEINEENINAYFGVANDVTESEPPATETEPPVTETEPPVTEIEKELWQKLYSDKLSEYTGNDSCMFDLFYLDDDEIPELFISNGNYHMATVEVFTVQNDELVSMGHYSEYGEILVTDDNMLVSYYMGQGHEYISFYTKDGSEMKNIVSFYNDAGAVGDDLAKYQIDDETVSKNEFDEKLAPYDNMEWIVVGRKYNVESAIINSDLKELAGENSDNIGNDVNNSDDESNNDGSNGSSGNSGGNSGNSGNTGSSGKSTETVAASPDTSDRSTAGLIAGIISAVSMAFVFRKRK